MIIKRFCQVNRVFLPSFLAVYVSFKIHIHLPNWISFCVDFLVGWKSFLVGSISSDL